MGLLLKKAVGAFTLFTIAYGLIGGPALEASSLSDQRNLTIDLVMVASVGWVAWQWLNEAKTTPEPTTAPNTAPVVIYDGESSRLSLKDDLAKQISGMVKQRKLTDLLGLSAKINAQKAALGDELYARVINYWLENTAQLQVTLGQYQEAAATLNDCLKNNTYVNADHVYYLYGISLTKLGKATEAQDWFKKISRRSPYFKQIPR